MKHFWKSFITCMMIGLPIVTVLCVFLFVQNNNNQHLENVPEKPVSIGKLENIENSDAPVIENNDTTSAVTFSFAGDVHFSELIIQNYDKKGISALADEEMIAHMQAADLFVLNHEFAFSNRGEAMADKQYTLRNDPKYVKILQELGTDVVSLANNHVLDFGKDAFLDTLDTLENARITYTGAGRNFDEASTPAIQTIQGQTFAIFGASRVAPTADWYAGKDHPGVFQTYDPTKLNEAIAKADPEYDHVIVFVHWGIERSEYPEEYQRTLAKGYIDAGADLIIGCHPHILQGFEYYKEVPIVYSLGNYLFGNRSDPTVLLNAVFSKDGDITIQLIPCKRVDGVLQLIDDPSKLFNYLTDLSFDAAVSQGGVLIR